MGVPIRVIFIVAALLVPWTVSAFAEERPTVSASGYAIPIEGFMTLTGRITVDADGAVSGYVLDHADQVPAEVRELLARRVGSWHIEFEAGVSAPEEAVAFAARLRASPAGDGLYRLWLDGVHVDEPLPSTQRLVVTRKRRPQYPASMARIGAGGIVYAIVVLGPDGRVEQAYAEQVDLTAVSEDPRDLAHYQSRFMTEALVAVRDWRFRIPGEGPFAAERQAVRIPIAFTMADQPVAYGQWQYLVRGVRRRPPWADGEADDGIAIAAAGVQPARARMRVVMSDPAGSGT